MRLAQITTALTLGAVLAHSASAQDADIANKINVELNSAETREGSCTLIFLVTNGSTIKACDVQHDVLLRT